MNQEHLVICLSPFAFPGTIGGLHYVSYPLFSISLWQITSTLTFSAACASAGITVLIGNDLNDCAENHCAQFQTATAMAFLSWFAGSPSFLLNFWTLASK